MKLTILVLNYLYNAIPRACGVSRSAGKVLRLSLTAEIKLHAALKSLTRPTKYAEALHYCALSRPAIPIAALPADPVRYR